MVLNTGDSAEENVHPADNIVYILGPETDYSNDLCLLGNASTRPRVHAW
jgi:hypothetical protein